MIGLHHIISLFIYSLISFFNRKNNPHFHPSSYVGTLTSFLTSSSALELAFPSDAERCFLAKTEHSHPLGMVVSTHFRCGKGVKRGLKNGALPFNID